MRKRYAREKLKVRQIYLEGLQKQLSVQLISALQGREALLTELNPGPVKVLDTLQVLISELKQEIDHVKTLEVKLASNTSLALQSIDKVANELKGLILLYSQPIPLEIRKIKVNQLLDEALSQYREEAFGLYCEVLHKLYTQHDEIWCDVIKIKQLIISSLSHAQSHNPGKHPITILLEDALLGYKMSNGTRGITQVQAIKITITTLSKLTLSAGIYITELSAGGARLLEEVEDMR